MSEIYALIQARMSSKRLPGKVLKKIENKTLIEHITKKLSSIKEINKIIVITSRDISDNKIVEHCRAKKIIFFRGNLHNVYKRFYDAIKHYNIKSLIRITCDSPMISNNLIKKGLNIFKKNKYDIVTNTLIKSYPKGQSFEIIKASIISKNFKFINSKKEREHLTYYFYKNRNKFKIYNKKNPNKLKYKNLSVDTQEDFNFLSKNFKKLSKIEFK